MNTGSQLRGSAGNSTNGIVFGGAPEIATTEEWVGDGIVTETIS